MSLLEKPSSPKWSSTTKLIIGLTMAGILLALVFRFQNILAPLLLAVLLAYLFHPISCFFSQRLKVPWKLVSTILYLLVFAILIGLLAWGGFSIVTPIQNLIKTIQDLITQLPAILADLASKPLQIGPFAIDLSHFDLANLWTQLLGIVQPLLSQLGTLIGSLASGIGNTLTWLVFTLLISYFILAESDPRKGFLSGFSVPVYQEDFSKLGQQLGHIWNAFLRGQLLIFVITVAYYSALLSILGVRYFFLLAILAGLARFVPYVGPFVAWTTYGLVALFQTNYFGLLPFPYALIVVGCAWVSDLLLDNFMVPRVMSKALAIHPAAVLVMVILSASLFGVIGMLLAAPVLASLKLFATYIFRKLTDQDPWTGLKIIMPPEPIKVSLGRIGKDLAALGKKIWAGMLWLYRKVLDLIGKIKVKFKGEKNDSK